MQLGIDVIDTITGFTGVVIGHCSYLTGCSQALVQPVGTNPSVRPVAEWFDVQRLTQVGDTVIELDNGITPGCDRAAPKR